MILTPGTTGAGTFTLQASTTVDTTDTQIEFVINTVSDYIESVLML